MKLSVLMLAYNHEEYISAALDSVMAQQTDFDYEIVIGEDCSTDGTREILLGYRERYPDRIRLLLPETNLGMMANLIQTFEACRGEYIALLEGDDYWTSPHKLQRQVDFLESHPECAECFHNVEVVVEGRPEQNRLFIRSNAKPLYTLRDVVPANFIPTCAVVLRANSIPSFPGWFAAMPIGDWPLHVLAAEHGDIAYLTETMGAYRVHGGGVWSGASRFSILEKSLQVAEVIDQHLNGRFTRIIKKSMAGRQREAASLLLEQGAYRQALARAWRAVTLFPRKGVPFFVLAVTRTVIGLVPAALRGRSSQR